MSTALHAPPMTREAFFGWAEAQNERYEFDGFHPVAITGGAVDHSQIAVNILVALRGRLRGSGCRTLGPDAGVATTGNAVRYPDALVTCTKVEGRSRLVPGVVVVFEVVSPGNPATDRILKVREYLAVPSIRTYVIVEQETIGLTVLDRRDDDAWTATTLTSGDVLRLAALSIDIPVLEFYEDTDVESSTVMAGPA